MAAGLQPRLVQVIYPGEGQRGRSPPPEPSAQCGEWDVRWLGQRVGVGRRGMAGAHSWSELRALPLRSANITEHVWWAGRAGTGHAVAPSRTHREPWRVSSDGRWCWSRAPSRRGQAGFQGDGCPGRLHCGGRKGRSRNRCEPCIAFVALARDLRSVPFVCQCLPQVSIETASGEGRSLTTV